VIHVAAVWRESAQSFVTLAIGEESPASETDRFLLGVARARADAILTTGRILRREPAVTHALDAPAGWSEALEAWRRERLGKREPPLSVVLTSGRGLDLEHPLFRSGTRTLVYTSEGASRELAGRAAALGVEVVGRPRPGPRDALDHLARVRGVATLSIEAGPSTSLALYKDPFAVDELMLSIYLEPTLPAAVRGPAFLSPARIAATLGSAPRGHASREASGRWLFRRYRVASR
jgi:riboflavin biosynthesis pyrimidine reductase